MKVLDHLRTYFDSLAWWKRYGFPKPLYNALSAPQSTDYELILAAMSSERSPLIKIFPGLLDFFESPKIQQFNWFYQRQFFSEELIQFKDIELLKQTLEKLNEHKCLPHEPWSRRRVFIECLRIDLPAFYAELSELRGLSTTDLFQLIDRYETNLRRTTNRLPRIKAEEVTETYSNPSSVEFEKAPQSSPVLV